MRHYFLAPLNVLLGLLVFASAAIAQTYPSKPITIIIPFAAGGTADPVARVLADVIGKKTGAKFIIESKPGAGGNIGNQTVAKADKDGYTLLLGANNNFVVNQYVFPKSAVDVEKDFSLISILVDQPQVVYVPTAMPVKSFQEMITFIKGKPGVLNYGSPGAGSAPHLAGEILSDLYGLDMVHIAYKGGAPAVTALLSGDIQLYFASMSVGKGQVQAGKLKALATTSPVRLSGMPDLPTTKELGHEKYNVINWWGLATASGAPAESIHWVQKEFAAALKDPTVVKRLEELGFVIYGSTPAQFEERVKRESAIYKELIAKRKITG